MALDEYNRKRDFSATPEPGGNGEARKRGKSQALQYCIQKHDATRLHYDFRLELDGTLKSWAVPKGPSLDPKARRLAVHVEDHPLDYATFEGSIPKGHYGAGDVIVWDRGVWIPEGDPHEGYAKGKLKFSLEGEKLSGSWNLVRTRMEGGKEQWFLIKSKDEAARPEQEYEIVKELPDSVLSDRTLIPRKRGKAKPEPAVKPVDTPARKRSRQDEPKVTLTGAKRAPLPDSLKPQLATLVESVPDGDWRYEIKFDGYRVMARIESGKVQLFTRNGHDWTQKMPQQAEALAGLGLESAWLDGEVVVPDKDGTPDFQALQNAFEAGRSGSILYYLFDLPYLNGMDLRDVTLEERRAALHQILDSSQNESELLRFSADFTEQPESMLESACQMKLEGLIGKRAGSTYVSRRSNSWVKIKCKNRQEFVIVGYTDPKGARSGFGALLLGLHDEQGHLRYAGKVGTGFNQATLQSLHAKLQPLEIDRPALAEAPPAADVRGAHWLAPELMCEVAYAEMTRQGVVRHSVFHGLRSDKPAEAITHERPAKAARASRPATARQAAAASSTSSAKIKISNPERVIDKSIGATKMELARFYAEVAPWALPHLRQRPLALVRAPEGIDGELFFQKHTEKLSIPHITQLDTALFPKHAALMTIDSTEALISAAQMGTIELHTWNAVAPVLDHPDRFVLDLDPDPALPWKRMVEATHLTQTLLDEIGLQSFLKTSGGKGLHIIVPLEPIHSWAEVKAFSQGIAKYMARLMPQHFSAVSGPKNRVGRIFIDYLRNSQGASTVAAYSVRAREGLAVSVPIHRSELADLKGANIWTIRNLMPRLEEQGDDDPWEGIDTCEQIITATMLEQLGMK